MDVANNFQQICSFHWWQKGEGDNVVDNFCDSVGAVVGGTGIKLHHGWLHPFVAAARTGRADN